MPSLCVCSLLIPSAAYSICALPINFGNNVIGDSSQPQGDCQKGFPLFPASPNNTQFSCAVACQYSAPPDPSTIPGIYSCSVDAATNFATLSAPNPTLDCKDQGCMLARPPCSFFFSFHSMLRALAASRSPFRNSRVLLFQGVGI